MNTLTREQGIYLSFAIIGGLIVLGLIFLLVYRNFLQKKRIKKIVSSRLYRFADVNDYLLLNDYHINIDDNNIGVIDHILITNKFIIVINDFSISGVISGELEADSLKVTTKKGEQLIPNPLNYNRNLGKRLALYHDLDNSFLRGLVVVNNDTVISTYSEQNQYVITRLNDLKKAINKFDSIDVKPFNEDAIVNFINFLNDNRIKKGEKR